MAGATTTSATSAPTKLIERPVVAMAATMLLVLLAGYIYPNITPFPGLAKHLFASVVIFMALQTTTVLIHRRFGHAAGEWVGIVLGLSVYLLLAGPAYTCGLLCFVLVTHYVLVRVLPYPMTMLILFVGLLVFAFYVPAKSMFGLVIMRGIRWIAFWGVFRLIFYSFEFAALRKDERTVRQALGYTVFSWVLFIGCAPSLLLMRSGKATPRTELDRIAVRQLSRGGVKFVLVSLVRLWMAWLCPDLHMFDQLPFVLKTAVVLTLCVEVGYRMSGAWDIAAGIGNFCGYTMVDPYDNPWFAVSPRMIWRKMNVPLIDFYLRVVGFPLMRKIRHWRFSNLIFYVWMAFAVSLWHVLEFNFIAAGAMTLRPTSAYLVFTLKDIAIVVGALALSWMIGERMELIAKRGKILFVLMLITAQVYWAQAMFAEEYSGTSNYSSKTPVSLPEARCMLRRWLRPNADCTDIKEEFAWRLSQSAAAKAPVARDPKPTAPITP